MLKDLKNLMYKISRTSGKIGSVLNDVNDISSGNYKKVATRKVKNKLKRNINKSINKFFK